MITVQHIGFRPSLAVPADASDRRGFTLVELLVALVLLNVGLVALVALTAALTRAGDDARATTRAYRAASSRLERLASLSCGAPLRGAATPLPSLAETYTDTPEPNDTRSLRDSVVYAVPGRLRSVVIESRARC